MEGEKRKILIVDDDNFLLDMYALKFSQNNFEVHTAISALLAVDKLKEWTPLTFNMRFPEIKPEAELKIFAWNNTYWPVFIDDMKVELYELK